MVIFIQQVALAKGCKGTFAGFMPSYQLAITLHGNFTLSRLILNFK